MTMRISGRTLLLAGLSLAALSRPVPARGRLDKGYVTCQQAQADTFTYGEGRSVNAIATLRF